MKVPKLTDNQVRALVGSARWGYITQNELAARLAEGVALRLHPAFDPVIPFWAVAHSWELYADSDGLWAIVVDGMRWVGNDYRPGANVRDYDADFSNFVACYLEHGAPSPTGPMAEAIAVLRGVGITGDDVRLAYDPPLPEEFAAE